MFFHPTALQTGFAPGPPTLYADVAPVGGGGGGGDKILPFHSMTVTYFNAQAERLVMQRVDSNNVEDLTYPAIIGFLGDLADAGNREARFTWFYFKDAKNNCAPMKCKVWMTAPEPDA